jgi:hypothetical protein
MSHSKRIRDSGSRRKSLFLADPQSDSGPEDDFNPIELVCMHGRLANADVIDESLQVTPAFAKKRVDHMTSATPNFRASVHAQAAPPAAFLPSASKHVPAMLPPPSAVRVSASHAAANVPYSSKKWQAPLSSTKFRTQAASNIPYSTAKASYNSTQSNAAPCFHHRIDPNLPAPERQYKLMDLIVRSEIASLARLGVSQFDDAFTDISSTFLSFMERKKHTDMRDGRATLRVHKRPNPVNEEHRASIAALTAQLARLKQEELEWREALAVKTETHSDASTMISLVENNSCLKPSALPSFVTSEDKEFLCSTPVVALHESLSAATDFFRQQSKTVKGAMQLAETGVCDVSATVTKACVSVRDVTMGNLGLRDTKNIMRSLMA